MKNLKLVPALISIILVSTALHPAAEIFIKNFFSLSEINISVNGEFLTSAQLKGKGSVRSSGVEKALPVSSSYISMPSGYDMAAVEKGFFNMNGDESGRQKIYRALTDIQGLKGTVYYSMSEGENYTLILDSYITRRDPAVKKENHVSGKIPENSVFHFAVKDNRLGIINFRSEVIVSGENFIMINTSTGTSSRFGMKIFDPGDYRIYKFLIYDKSRKGYFFYTVQFMKVRSSILSKMDLIKPESFGNRVRAGSIHFLKSMGIDRSGKLAAFK